MSDIKIEVVEDSDHPEGGHAVIRLNGLWLLPANATFRIEPVDAPDPALLPADWPRGDRSPLATRLTPHGVEIIVGPDVVDAPPMLPGTPVAVSVPAAFVKAEVLWPDLPVSMPAAAPPVVLTAAELAAELDAVALVSRQREEAAALAQLRQHMNGGDTAHARTNGDHGALSELRPRDSSSRDVLDVSAMASDVSSAGSRKPPASSFEDVVAAGAGHGGAGHRPPEKGTALLADPPRPRALIPVGSAPPPLRRNLSMGMPFALGFVIAALLTGIFAWRSGGAVSRAGDSAMQAASLADVLAVAVVSPRGRSAAEVDLPTALKLADESLHMTAGGADHAEASFWLRKSIALAVGTPQLSWTLTQLGTLYAKPAAGPADYGKARLLWEMAGASGDATALCFLGALHENGLGVSKSPRLALGLYQRAKAQGGCRDVDDAIARVRN